MARRRFALRTSFARRVHCHRRRTYTTIYHSGAKRTGLHLQFLFNGSESQSVFHFLSSATRENSKVKTRNCSNCVLALRNYYLNLRRFEELKALIVWILGRPRIRHVGIAFRRLLTFSVRLTVFRKSIPKISTITACQLGLSICKCCKLLLLNFYLSCSC